MQDKDTCTIMSGSNCKHTHNNTISANCVLKLESTPYSVNHMLQTFGVDPPRLGWNKRLYMCCALDP